MVREKTVTNLALVNTERRDLYLLVPLLTLSFGLIGRKTGLSFGSGLILFSGIWISASCFLSGSKRLKKVPGAFTLPEEFLFGTCLALNMFQQQYWLHGPMISLVAAILFAFAMLGSIFQNRILSFGIVWTKGLWPTPIRIYFTLLLIFLFSTGVILNPKQFHNFFRYSTYEEYLRSQYSYLKTEEANKLLRKYNDGSENSRIEATKLFEQAKTFDKQKDLKNALRMYNLSIDKFPFSSELYLQRGKFKISKLELNKGLAYSAIIDFSESIRLGQDKAGAYFQRGVIYSYLDEKEHACEDMHEAYKLDSSLNVIPFIKKCCPEDSTAFIPFNP
jgi:tetratricopeptide (TPR) repeat protein